MKISKTGIEARNKAVAGLKYVADAIVSTIGPYGQNFLLEKSRKVTNDGISIANELVNAIPDEYERLAAQVANEASSKTNDMVGDATSTAWGLNYNIVNEAIRYLPNERTIKAKKTPAELGLMIQKSKDNIIKRLQESSTPITSKEELIKSALVSVEDEELANIIGSMQWELGPNGRIIAEEVNDTKCSIEKVEGLVLDNGFTSSGLVTNPETQTLELSDFPIFLTNYTFDEKDLISLREPIFNQLILQKKPGIIIMARAFTPQAIKLCSESLSTGFGIIPINAPYTDQREVMKDIQAVVGGRYIDTEEASLQDVYITDVGFAKKIVAKQFNAIIAGPRDEHAKKRISDRITTLFKRLKGEESDFYKKMIEDRIAQLDGGLAILKVGSRSVVNRKRLKDKADDAVNAVRHALKGGTIKGAGLALKEISDTLPDDDILKRPILCIYDAIMKSAPEGFQIESWVRDPFIVIKTALENACEFATAFISVNGIVTTENPKKGKEESDE